MNPHQDTSAHSPDHGTGKNSPLCILVVEDDRAVANMFEAAIRTWGYEVRIARNSQEGVKVVATQFMDGILLDMHMPIMDGRTMLDELRWTWHELPVWMMSGGMDIQTLQQLIHEEA